MSDKVDLKNRFDGLLKKLGVDLVRASSQFAMLNIHLDFASCRPDDEIRDLYVLTTTAKEEEEDGERITPLLHSFLLVHLLGMLSPSLKEERREASAPQRAAVSISCSACTFLNVLAAKNDGGEDRCEICGTALCQATSYSDTVIVIDDDDEEDDDDTQRKGSVLPLQVFPHKSGGSGGSSGSSNSVDRVLDLTALPFFQRVVYSRRRSAATAGKESSSTESTAVHPLWLALRLSKESWSADLSFGSGGDIRRQDLELLGVADQTYRLRDLSAGREEDMQGLLCFEVFGKRFGDSKRKGKSRFLGIDSSLADVVNFNGWR